MRVDKGGGTVVEVHVLDGQAHRVGAQAGAPDGPGLEHLQGRGVQGEAAGGGGVLQVEDGEDAVEDGVGQEGDGTQAQDQEGGDKPPIPEEDEDCGGKGGADPAGPGVGHAQGGGAHAGGAQGAEPPPPGAAAQHQGHRQGEEHHQHLGKGVGVFKDGEDATGHALVEEGVHIGVVDLHALDALHHAVGRGGEKAHGGEARQPLEVVRPLHGAHRHRHAQHGREVEKEEAHGERGRIGHRPGQAHRPGEDEGVRAHALQVQAQAPAAHPTHHEERRDQEKAHEGIAVVPVLIGEHQDPQHEPADGRRGLGAHGEAQLGEEAVVEEGLALPVDPVEDGGGEVDDGLRQAAEKAVPPRLGQDAVPDQQVHEGAAPEPPGPAPGEATEEAAHQAALIPPV